jgi:hypothetical protein
MLPSEKKKIKCSLHYAVRASKSRSRVLLNELSKNCIIPLIQNKGFHHLKIQHIVNKHKKKWEFYKFNPIINCYNKYGGQVYKFSPSKAKCTRLLKRNWRTEQNLKEIERLVLSSFTHVCSWTTEADPAIGPGRAAAVPNASREIRKLRLREEEARRRLRLGGDGSCAEEVGEEAE